MIEYTINADGSPGKSWNPYSGCLHSLEECPTADKCWARALAKRFPQICKGDFSPRFHPDRLDVPCHWRKPQRIATCFMGDLFDEWNSIYGRNEEIVKILTVVEKNPKHTFLFLTKNPRGAWCYEPFPRNAWFGVSITGILGDKDVDNLDVALLTSAHWRWVSYEPALGPLHKEALELIKGFDWLVIGAQTGPGACKPKLEWVMAAEEAAKKAEVPVWRKNNLCKVLGLEPRQELPESMS